MRRLQTPQYKDYDKLCRYTSFPYYYDSVEKHYFYGTTTYLRNDTTYTLHKVEQFDTWDSLASYYYNNPTYFWVICSFNRISDPFKNPKVGTFVKIPTFSEIKFDT